MQRSGIGGSSQGRKSTDLIKVATRERQRGGVRETERRDVWERVRLFTAGHNHQVSITSCPHYYAYPVGVAGMCEANHALTYCRKIQVHQYCGFKKNKKKHYYALLASHTDTWAHTTPGMLRSIFVPSKWALKNMWWLSKCEAFFFFYSMFCSGPFFGRTSLQLSSATGL